MSEIITDKLTGKTSAGDVTVTVGATVTQSLGQGLVKYRIHFDMQDNGITDSLNSSSITDNNTGRFHLNYVNNTSAIEYAFSAYSNGYSGNNSFGTDAGGYGVSWSDNTKTTNTDGMGFASYSSGAVDGRVNVAVVVGDLA